ncbi:MAG: MarR family transcriptional regulator [Lachnospiraceae bacterium]|nr:MarR family transcriptional regulator [Lachnospiraceae bacterium]
MENNSSCSILLKQIHDVQKKNIDNTLRNLDLTFSQINVLRALVHTAEKQMSLKELEKTLHVAQSTTARIVAKMESKGLIESFGDVSDKRIKYIRLTQYGEQYSSNAKQKLEEEETRLLSSLTETEKMVFVSLLQKITSNLS